MNICMVGHTTTETGEDGPSRGIVRYFYHVAEELNKKDNVEYFARKSKKITEPWVHQVYCPGKSWVPYPIALTKYLLRKNADVFHADYVTTGTPLVLLRKKPTLVNLYDAIPFLEKADGVNNAGLRLFMSHFKVVKRAAGIIVLSEDSKEKLVKLSKVDKEKVFVVPENVDLDRYYQLKKDKHQKFRIGYVGGLDARKNVKLLVDAFEQMVKKDDSIELHVGGGGRMLEKFRDRNIPNAKFYGFIPRKDMNKFYNSLDLFVYPSLREGFAGIPIQAMAAGVPTIVTNVDSMPESVEGASLLFEPNVESLINAITLVKENKNMQTKLKKKGLKRSRELSTHNVTKMVKKTYEMVIN